MRNYVRSLTTNLQSWALVAVIAILSSGGLLVGCGSDDAMEPNGPTFDDGQFITIDQTGGNGSLGSGGSGSGGRGGEVETVVVKSVNVNSTEGATLSNGRYSMTIPAGAFPGSTEYKITQDPNNPHLTCVLEPHSVEFSSPVIVKFDLSGTDASQHSDVRAQWFDEGTQRWFDVPSEWDPDTQILTGYYDHFCHGRAGW